MTDDDVFSFITVSKNSFVPIDIKKIKDDKYEHSLFTTVDEDSEVESDSVNSDKKTAIRKFKIEQKKIVDSLIKKYNLEESDVREKKFSFKEYYDTHPEFRERHLAKLRKRSKCECGTYVQKSHLLRHKKTMKHMSGVINSVINKKNNTD